MDVCKRLDEVHERLTKASGRQLGYPLNCRPFYDSDLLDRFNKFCINNLGDPFAGGTYAVNTFPEEREVVRFFADLFHLSEEETWGYVTSGGSEGNHQGLALAKLRFPDGIVYHSDRAHYSVWDAIERMGLDSRVIPSNADHSINLSGAFTRELNPYRPAIVMANLGTTFGGGVDNIYELCQLLKHRDDYHIHVDAALAGWIFPHFQPMKMADGTFQNFDFSQRICSMCISGHKMLQQMPCGVFLCRRDCIAGREVEYIGSRTTTYFGSRNGHSVLGLWTAINSLGRDGLERIAVGCMAATRTLMGLLQEIGWAYRRLHKFSNIVVIERPPDAVANGWQLAVEGEQSHVIVMPHCTVTMLNEFVRDLEATRCLTSN